MPRARNIKPSLFTNEVLGTMDPIINLTFIGLWCLADRNGILEDRPLRIKAELFPYRENLDINGYLTVLERTDFIERYEVDGKRYIQVVNFERHQSPHHTEKSRGYPRNPLQKAKLKTLTVTQPLLSGEYQVPTRSDSLIPDSNTCAVGTDVCVEVFEHWKITLNHPKAKLDKSRKKIISERLKDGYSPEDLKAAICGCKNSEFHMGKNDRKTVFDGLDLILRNADNVDKFIQLAKQPQKINGERRPAI